MHVQSKPDHTLFREIIFQYYGFGQEEIDEGYTGCLCVELLSLLYLHNRLHVLIFTVPYVPYSYRIRVQGLRQASCR